MAQTKPRRLGRGLADLLPTPGASPSGVVSLQVDQIRPGRFQPRASIGEQALEELKASIRSHGVIQPIIVRPLAHGTYEIVAGERRWRAAQAIGLQEVTAIIKPLSDREALEYSLIENLQRDDLNPIEASKAFAKLIEEFGYSQDELAGKLGKDRTSVANTLRLQKLPADVQRALGDGSLTMGHAKVLLSVESAPKQTELAKQTIREGLSVRALEELVSRFKPRKARRVTPLDPHLKTIEDILRQKLGTKVSVMTRKRGGRIIIEYFSSADLERLLHTLGIHG